MSEQNDKFYNMRVDLVNNGRIYTENVAIRNIWEKDSSIFFDIYCHRLKKSFVFDSLFIHGIYDINRDKAYSDISLFIKDFKAISQDQKELKPIIKKQSSYGVFETIKEDVIILLFMSRRWHENEQLKNRIIIDYILDNCENAKDFSEQYIRSFISRIQPEIEDFYLALNKLKSKTIEKAEYFLREIVKICISDGHMHYIERMYLADIVYVLRSEGMPIPDDLL